ncbi:MAG: SGNH hydrolase domain-containing protein, partial [Conchiformibius sp.]|nr:SGNH hydrolase domain-containing protein [Conchiformibius sp.]
KLLSMGKNIYVFKDNFYAKYPVLRQFHLYNLGMSLVGNIDQDNIDYQFKKDNDLSNERLRELLNKYPEIKWVDVNKYIPNNFIIDGLPIYKDKDHINPYGARKLAERFSQHEILIKD